MAHEHTIVLRQHFRPEQAGEYVLLPFEVPTGAARLHVSYAYDCPTATFPGAPPGNALDLGLFDARGAGLGMWEGFRGWSGTAREQFIITPVEATPGYLPGPLPPGLWHVLLGLYKLAPGGCNVEVTVHIEHGSVPEPQPLHWFAPPRQRGLRWYRGDLHCHSHHSEAAGTLAELCAAAREQGLDFLAVTEHNTTSHHRLLGEFHTTDFLPIAGQEVTTYLGHACVWGATHWIDFRARSDADLARIIQWAHGARGLISANHPKTNGPPWEFGTFAGLDCLEVWGGPWFLSNYQSLAVWDGLLRSGQRIVGVGGSDEHQPTAPDSPLLSRIGRPTTWVYAPALEAGAILGAIQAGHVAISAGPQGPHLTCEAWAGDAHALMGDSLAVAAGDEVRIRGSVLGAEGLDLRLVGAEGLLALLPISSDEFTYEHSVRVERPTYVRTEVAAPIAPEDAHEPAALIVQALGNPVYIQVN
ncbi:MAG: CehA/McbA family metallohydrolase [Anaerolineae bacterium]